VIVFGGVPGPFPCVGDGVGCVLEYVELKPPSSSFLGWGADKTSTGSCFGFVPVRGLVGGALLGPEGTGYLVSGAVVSGRCCRRTAYRTPVGIRV
jgi:hypothetical protein